MILISKIICTGFGIGKSPFFPGTLASFSILPIVWIMKKNLTFDIFLILLFIYTIISFFLIKNCLKNEIDKDPGYIVIDEHIGQAITLIFCNEILYEYFIAFILFRFFDILKPFPINYFDKLKNPIGVIGDDILAGLISGLIIFFIL
tara:strand:- start:128 stop:568 length:441 start_codon:yes stop_codon:yes gene_type:complete